MAGLVPLIHVFPVTPAQRLSLCAGMTEKMRALRFNP